MSKEKEYSDFFQNLASNIDNLDFCMGLCENKLNSDRVELTVISAGLMRVFDEISLYLEYFNSEIAKKFGFVGVGEWERIKREVLEDFAREIEERDLDTQSERLRITSYFIQQWNNFPREEEGEIMNRGKGNNPFG